MTIQLQLQPHQYARNAYTTRWTQPPTAPLASPYARPSITRPCSACNAPLVCGSIATGSAATPPCLIAWSIIPVALLHVCYVMTTTCLTQLVTHVSYHAIVVSSTSFCHTPIITHSCNHKPTSKSV